MKKFHAQNERLMHQFENICWDEKSGLREAELREAFLNLMRNEEGYSKAGLKAKLLELIAEKSRIAIDEEDIFQDKLFGGGLPSLQRAQWEKQMIQEHLADEFAKASQAWEEFGAYSAHGDYGHTSGNTKLLMKVGVPGLIERLEKAQMREGLSADQADYYASCITALRAVLVYLQRLADGVQHVNPENAQALQNLTKGAPETLYEALQLLIAYFFFHEYVAGTRMRTLGRLDVLLLPFYEKEMSRSLDAKEEIRNMFKFFLNKFWTAKVPYDLPFCLGGMDEEGNEVTNEVSYLLVETYNEMNIHSPKIHIRVSDQTPESFVKLVLRCIRGGNSSFVFISDAVCIKALKAVGIEERDARDYVPIGCYEPAVWGVEMGSTGNGSINLAKALEYVMTGGVDLKSGKPCGTKVSKVESYEDFVKAVKEQIRAMIESAVDVVVRIEKLYREITPDPILSAMYEESVERGLDVYEGGAKYNNSGLNLHFIANLADSMAVVKKFVFEEKRVGFEEFCEILKNDWKGHEDLRAAACAIPEKYGNNQPDVDEIAREMAEFCAGLLNGRPNGRGGVFKTGFFSIDRGFQMGPKTMATPDGRRCAEPLSKNLSAVVGMDRNGVTALILSATKMDHSLFPNGSVLDILLHPSAVQGEDGLDAFYALIKTYMKRGGFAIHGNVFDAGDLRKAQKDPEKYKNLQIRVCGWNAYFVKLSRAEQDAFIRQAENAG